MFNVVNPDMIVEKFGADTLRLYEMFLGPVEQSKPWDTNGIDGCHRFLKKFWKIYTEQKRAVDQLRQELEQKKALVDQVERSKAWKLYRTVKRV